MQKRPPSFRRSSAFATLAGFLVLTVFGFDSAAHAQSGSPWQLQAGVGYHFSTGKYRENRSTEVGYAPLVLRGDYSAFGLELTLPYIRVRGPSGIAGIVSDPNDSSNDIQEEDGFGDVQIAPSYTLRPLASWMPYSTVEVRVKAPTASSSRGLGTGEWDVTTALDAVWEVAAFQPFIGVSYEYLGDPGIRTAADGSTTGFELNNGWRARAGLGYAIRPAWSAGLLFEYGTPTSDDAGDRADLVPYTSVLLDESWLVQAYGTAGLADGSADGGVGLQVTWIWRPARDRTSPSP